MTNILLVEDDISFVHIIKTFLEKRGFEVDSSLSIKSSKSIFEKRSYDLVLLDYHLPDGTAFDFINYLHLHESKVPVVIMTGFNDVRTAVKAMRGGVSDYITKPVNAEELLMRIKQVLIEEKQPDHLPLTISNTFIKGKSTVSEHLNKHIELVAPTEMSVIVIGESGTGKENIAQTIHKQSKRSSGPFVAIDCGALSDELASSELFGHVKGAFTGAVFDKLGEFETANGGTLFLDEVGNLSYAVQVKLLRAIQERVIQPVGGNKLIKVDVRIIAATNDDLSLSVKNGSFREDLYHRLNEFSIAVPALRERKEDLELFLNHFIEQANLELSKAVKGCSSQVADVFANYKWPGNLRELKNIIKRGVLLSSGEYIQIEDIPAEMYHVALVNDPKKKDTNLKSMNEGNERELIIKTLHEVKFNKTKAASLLKIDRKTLYLKILRYGIDL